MAGGFVAQFPFGRNNAAVRSTMGRNPAEQWRCRCNVAIEHDGALDVTDLADDHRPETSR
jgi:hypothetical protein